MNANGKGHAVDKPALTAVIHTAERSVLVQASGWLLLVVEGEILPNRRHFAFDPAEVQVIRLDRPARELVPFEAHLATVRRLIDEAFATSDEEGNHA